MKQWLLVVIMVASTQYVLDIEYKIVQFCLVFQSTLNKI